MRVEARTLLVKPAYCTKKGLSFLRKWERSKYVLFERPFASRNGVPPKEGEGGPFRSVRRSEAEFGDRVFYVRKPFVRGVRRQSSYFVNHIFYFGRVQKLLGKQ